MCSTSTDGVLQVLRNVKHCLRHKWGVRLGIGEQVNQTIFMLSGKISLILWDMLISEMVIKEKFSKLSRGLRCSCSNDTPAGELYIWFWSISKSPIAHVVSTYKQKKNQNVANIANTQKSRWGIGWLYFNKGLLELNRISC